MADQTVKVGERCLVADLRRGTVERGVVLDIWPGGRVVVRYDNGTKARVHPAFVASEKRGWQTRQ
jgi:hypothetical protein